LQRTRAELETIGADSSCHVGNVLNVANFTADDHRTRPLLKMRRKAPWGINDLMPQPGWSLAPLTGWNAIRAVLCPLRTSCGLFSKIPPRGPRSQNPPQQCRSMGACLRSPRVSNHGAPPRVSHPGGHCANPAWRHAPPRLIKLARPRAGNDQQSSKFRSGNRATLSPITPLM